MFNSSHGQAALTILQIMIILIRIASVPMVLTSDSPLLTYNPQRLVPIYSRASPAARKAIPVSSNLDQSVLLHCIRLLHIPPPLSTINRETHEMLNRV